MFDNFPDPQSPHAMALSRMKSQMHADNRQENCLDVLQGMINGILIETGKALRASNKADGRSAAHSAIRLRSSIPATTNQFHLALDELEADIVRAQAVLARDLEELRAKNPTTALTTNDKEEPAIPEIDTQKSNADGVATIDKSAPLAIHTASKPPSMNPEDILPKPGAHSAASNAQEHDSQQPALAGTASKPSENKEQAEKGQEQKTGDGATVASGDAQTNDVPSGAPAPTVTAPDAADLSLDMIFEGMDVDANTKSVPDGLNFDTMEFTNNDGQDLQLDNNATQDLDALMFGDASGDNNNENSDNVASLLPGLENYANVDNNQDFDMSSFLPNDPPNDTKKTDAAIGETQEESKADNDDLFGDFGAIANESNFDDLLDGMDFGDGGDDNAGGEMMGSNEEFDNAFFGIE